jgi:trk system potassium uptake protein TrkA
MARRNGRKEFAIIGLGRFGTSVALTLVAQGHSVLGIDKRVEIVQQLADQMPQAVALDSTDEDALLSVGITDYETIVVAIGANFENNILTTVALKGLGVRRVVCKAQTERQRTILNKVGADLVVLPEHEAGERLAWRLVEPQLLDHFNLGAGMGIAEVPAPRWLVGQTLVQASLRRRFGINVIAVRRGTNLIVTPPIDLVFQENDLILAIGNDESVGNFCGQAG